MRVFAVSDLHLDYEENRRWVDGLSQCDYRADLLICAGDLSDSIAQLEWGVRQLARRFAHVLWVPGNHDLWVWRDAESWDSLEKFRRVREVVENAGASHEPFRRPSIAIVPLLSWYDYSFGAPAPDLRNEWADFRACRWNRPEPAIAEYFASLNEEHLSGHTGRIVSFSHFVPRMDLIPRLGGVHRLLPVLGTTRLEAQIRRLGPSIHVYGHCHINAAVAHNTVLYVNNALGYPRDTLTSKRIKFIADV